MNCTGYTLPTIELNSKKGHVSARHICWLREAKGASAHSVGKELGWVLQVLSTHCRLQKLSPCVQEHSEGNAAMHSST
eukprot:1158139-Pelagomonas_calceolata.AAC.4